MGAFAGIHAGERVQTPTGVEFATKPIEPTAQGPKHRSYLDPPGPQHFPFMALLRLPAPLLSLLRILLALVFLGAGLLKLSDLYGFQRAIGQFGLLPDAWIPAAAWCLALAEVLGALLVLAKRPSGLWLIGGLLVTFSAALLYGIWLGLDIDCGCLGPLESEGPTSLGAALGRDLLLLLICLTLLLQRLRPGSRRRDSPTDSP